MAIAYVEDNTIYTKEVVNQTTFSDECLWKTQVMPAPETDDYFDDITVGHMASGVETDE